VHGDYHLGQVLRTVDDDWTIIDFEGEPARTLEERRERSSALRDVAGMLRSFSYARAVVAQELHAGATERDALMKWELSARDAFVSGYRAAFAPSTPHSGVPLVPSSENAFWSALAAWEADKALYEVAYEARNRPGWIAIPLRSLIPDLSGQS
jgi:maltose alpha-D-glucosyltransferase/alpha-amylase